ncbi:MAG TPA: acetyl-CoA carboxylase biotin carboxylase subunit [Vicinamibacteria bacterium]|nr:acetyl-CoA carboxylase biotin carboxylase subunit [Vicinamibacteria bacterium]
MFDKVLIANRGEIAVRIARACREMSIRSVAVCSEADRDALHARLADELVPIGPAPSSQSYLVIDKILDAARRTHAQAIHPGYGFLAENADFARAVEGAGLVFIGPTPASLSLMGDKARARAAALRAGVPVVPGTEPVSSADAALAEAKRLGFPVVVKATGGGGGKGMRRVDDEQQLAAALEQARSEAFASFGNDSVYMEKYVEKPRHIEFQIVADSEGHVLHLRERECSIQRRHQKLIEESPSPFLDDELRDRMGEAAVSLAHRAGYRNVGTVEFLVDTHGNFFFLEMNPRLQVEHPVTELVTGIDLVALQMRLAAGEPIGFTQEDVVPRGWSMEFRITAEDPFQSFAPSAGTIDVLRPPEGPGIRHDSGVDVGAKVSPHYDPLIAKLIIWAEDRNRCVARAKRAIDEYRICGVRTTLPFFARILDDGRFAAGEMDVGFVDRHWIAEIASVRASEPEVFAAALAAAAVHGHKSRSQKSRSVQGDRSAWKLVGLREQTDGRF